MGDAEGDAESDAEGGVGVALGSSDLAADAAADRIQSYRFDLEMDLRAVLPCRGCGYVQDAAGGGGGGGGGGVGGVYSAASPGGGYGVDGGGRDGGGGAFDARVDALCGPLGFFESSSVRGGGDGGDGWEDYDAPGESPGSLIGSRRFVDIAAEVVRVRDSGGDGDGNGDGDGDCDGDGSGSGSGSGSGAPRVQRIVRGDRIRAQFGGYAKYVSVFIYL